MVPQAQDGLIPKIFCELDPETRIPIWGSWIVFIAVAVPAFFMDLEAITKLISMGNLLMFNFVSGCGIALRLRHKETQNSIKS